MPPYVSPSQENLFIVANQAIAEGLVLIRSIKSRTTTSPPANPAVLDAFILPTGKTGAWTAFSDGELVYYDSGWKAIGGSNPVTLNPDLMGLSPRWVEDKLLWVIRNGANWELLITRLPTFTTATKPAAANYAGGQILISDGGPSDNTTVLAVSDGANWQEIDFVRVN